MWYQWLADIHCILFARIAATGGEHFSRGPWVPMSAVHLWRNANGLWISSRHDLVSTRSSSSCI